MILVDYSYDFAKIKANYPEKIGLEQMRVICHISKKTARYLLTSGLVPCIDTGKKTRQYIINTKDVITYLKKRQSQPEKFSAPTGYYSASWNKGGKPKTLTLREWANLDTAKSRKKFQDFLTLKMQPYSDVLSVAEASRFTGYHHNTLTNWCHNGYMPSLGILTVASLVAADRVLIPVQAQHFALKGVVSLIKSINQITRRIKPELEIDGIVLTMVDRRTNLSKDVCAALRNSYGYALKIYRTEIPISTRTAESASSAHSVLSYDASGAASVAYKTLAKEVVDNERVRQQHHTPLTR